MLCSQEPTDVSDTENDEEQNCVVAEYYGPVSVFKLPKGLNLNNKEEVQSWYVYASTLFIYFADGTENQIEPHEDGWDYHNIMKEPRYTTIQYAEDYQCSSPS